MFFIFAVSFVLMVILFMNMFYIVVAVLFIFPFCIDGCYLYV